MLGFFSSAERRVMTRMQEILLVAIFRKNSSSAFAANLTHF